MTPRPLPTTPPPLPATSQALAAEAERRRRFDALVAELFARDRQVRP